MYTSYYFLFCMKVYLDMYAEYLLIIEFHNNNIVFPFSKSPTCLILSSCVKCQMTYGISHLSLAHIIHFLFNMLRSGSADIIFFYKHVNRFNQLFFRDYTSLNISKLLADFSRCFWLRKCSLHHLLSYRKTLVDNAASCM